MYLSSGQGAAWDFVFFYVVRFFHSDGRKYLSAAMVCSALASPFCSGSGVVSLHLPRSLLSLEISDDLVWVIDRSSFIVFVLFTPDMNERKSLDTFT